MDLSSFQNLNDLDFNDAGSWPLPIKVAAIAFVCIGVLAAGFFLDTKDQIINLESVEKKEVTLKSDFKNKQNKAVNLPLYKKQMEEMERSFGAMLRQLPSKTEVAELLVDVSQTGLSNGLKFQLFKPKDEIPAEFYAELPIELKVTGEFHEFGKFVSNVAGLPRIVTLQDIAIEPVSKGGKLNKGELVMNATAKTYRYLEDEE